MTPGRSTGGRGGAFESGLPALLASHNGSLSDPGQKGPPGHRSGQGESRGTPGRQVPDRDQRRYADRRGRRARLQAVGRDREGMAGHEVGSGPLAHVPPQVGPHPCARAALLARAVADPGRGGEDRRDLVPGPSGDGPPSPRRLRGQGRPLRPEDRGDPASASILPGRRRPSSTPLPGDNPVRSARCGEVG